MTRSLSGTTCSTTDVPSSVLVAAEAVRDTPSWFVATMWTISLVMIGSAAWALLAAWLRRGDVPTKGRRAQSSCLAIFAVPTLLLGLFFLSWAIGIS